MAGRLIERTETMTLEDTGVKARAEELFAKMNQDNTIEVLATQLVMARQDYAELKEEWEAVWKVFDERYSGLGSSMKAAKDAMNDAEDRLRAAGLEVFWETGEKQLPRGLGVRVTTQLKYDEADALAWAKAHNMALTLDKKAFEKIAKADTPEFVQVVEVPTVTLPTDTAKLLGGE